MDNVSFHHGEIITRTIHEHGHDVMYTPPYSPFLNPIEDLFHLIKGTFLKGEFFLLLFAFHDFFSKGPRELLSLSRLNRTHSKEVGFTLGHEGID